MVHAEYMQQPKIVEDLAEKLHPDFKQRLKQHSLEILKKRWGDDLPLLLADLGIITQEQYSQKLHCSADFLSKIGISSPADLQALELFNSPDFQYLELISEEATEDRTQLQTRAFNKKAIVSSLLDQLLTTAEKRSEETKQYLVVRDGDNVYEANNPWIAFQEKLKNIQDTLNTHLQTRQGLLKRFNPRSYEELVKEINALIDEFRTLERETQILKLYAYVNQWGMLNAWNKLRSRGIDSLATLLEKKDSVLPDIFNMGE
jgi:hypothetical protein